MRGNFTDLGAFRTTLTSLLSVKPTYMTTSRTLISNYLAICQSIAMMLISNYLAICQSIAMMLGICIALVFMLRAIFRLLERLFLRMLGIFHAIPPLMMVPNSLLIFHFIPHRNLALNITAKMVSCAIYDLDASKATVQTEFQPLSSRCVLQSFLLFILIDSKLSYRCKNIIIIDAKS